jgi:hypothetical protein
MIQHIGCFYSYEKAAILIANVREKKLILRNYEKYQNISVESIAKKIIELSENFRNNIWINEHDSLSLALNGRCETLAFGINNQKILHSIQDTYSSLYSTNRLELLEGIVVDNDVLLAYCFRLIVVSFEKELFSNNTGRRIYYVGGAINNPFKEVETKFKWKLNPSPDPPFQSPFISPPEIIHPVYIPESKG